MKRSVRLSLYSVTITALVAASSAIGCGQPAVAQKILDARRPNTTPPKFLLPQSSESASAPNTRSLLLFVHGIFGDTVGTWTRSADDKTLAHIVLSREEFKNGYDAFAFGFPSAIVKLGSFSIPQAATTLATEIEYRQFLKRYKQIVIVTHSMGGLVALEMLTANQDVRARVPLVVSFATPYNGSQASSLGDRLLENPAISDMLPRDSENSFLSSLHYRWNRIRQPLASSPFVVCAFERLPVPGIGLIVEETSASALCDDVAEPIAEDHIGIVKPDGDEHQSVKVLVNALRSRGQLPVAAKSDEAAACAPPDISADRGWDSGRATNIDFDGDGCVDGCRVTGNDNGKDPTYLECNLPARGGGAARNIKISIDWGYPGYRWWVDINRDGRHDYCRLTGVPGNYSLTCSLKRTGFVGDRIR